MIPIDMPVMLLGYMIIIFSEVFLWLLIAGLLALLIPRCRRYLLARRWRYGLLAVLLAAGSVPNLQITLDLWLERRAHNPRLEHDEVLGDLVLPAGTRVHLKYLEPSNDWDGTPIPYGLQSLDSAEFDRTPVNIMGLQVRSLKLRGYDATLQTLAAHEVEGWRCDAGQVEFKIHPKEQLKFSEWQLYACTLAAGTELGGIVWPGPVQIFRDREGWNARSEGHSMTLLGMRLRWLSMRGKQPYGPASSWSGMLDQPFVFGPVQYPAEVYVESFNGLVLFNLPPDTQAQDLRTHTPIEGGNTVVHRLAGEVLKVRPSRKLGDPFIDDLAEP